jgi:hypothetical protein
MGADGSRRDGKRHRRQGAAGRFPAALAGHDEW